MLATPYGVEIPQQLREIADRHQRHVADLINDLRAGGLDEAAVDGALDQIITAYRAQLLEAMKAFGGANP